MENFGGGSFTEPATLHEDVSFQLEELEEAAGIASHDGGAAAAQQFSVSERGGEGNRSDSGDF